MLTEREKLIQLILKLPEQDVKSVKEFVMTLINDKPSSKEKPNNDDK